MKINPLKILEGSKVMAQGNGPKADFPFKKKQSILEKLGTEEQRLKAHHGRRKPCERRDGNGGWTKNHDGSITSFVCGGRVLRERKIV